MGVISYAGRALDRLRSRGPRDMITYSWHIAVGYILTVFYDLRFGHKLCKTHPGSNTEREGHTVIDPSPYFVLRSIFERVSVAPHDVLVDVGCGEGRVINFWLSRGIKNQIIGIEANPETAHDAARRYRRFRNVSIVEAHAEKVASGYRRPIFYLFNPFSEKILRDFEQELRGSDARMVYNNFYSLAPFENDAWKIEIVRQTEPHWCQYRCAYIGPANS